MGLGDELIKTIQIMINRKLNNFKADRTYQSVVKRVVKKGYVILDETGNERIVKCCIPGVELRAGQAVYVKEPMGKLKELHICGVLDMDTVLKPDHTYESVIKEVKTEGYMVLDRLGNEITVKCSIPGISLKADQKVWLKEPMSDLQKIHICGVV